MTTARATSVLLVALLLVSSFGSVPAGVGARADTTATGESAAGNAGTQTFHVVQGGECYEVTALGDGEQNVSAFYDYRSGAGTLYGSYGEESQKIQENQVSHLFVYEGAEGLSLVMLHDDLNQSKGGAVSFRITGLPADREWVVEDDDYPNRDDNFLHNETDSIVHWMWGDERTDGAAVRGLGGQFDGVTIDAEWGENSWAYENRSNPWPYATDDIEEWQLRSGTGEEFTLDKDEPITIRKGSCSEHSDGSNGSHSEDGGSADGGDADRSEGTLSVSARNVTVGESVTFEASGFVGACENVTYEWDFDGDGDVDETTDERTVEHGYDDGGTYEATVTAVHEDGSEKSSSQPVGVEGDEQQPKCDPEEETDEDEAGEEDGDDEDDDNADDEESDGSEDDHIENDDNDSD